MKKNGIILLSVLTLVGCMEKDMFKDIHVYPTTSLPLGNIVTGDSALFALAGVEDYMSVGPDGVLAFAEGDTLPLSASDMGSPILRIPSQTFGINITLPPLPGAAGSTISIPDGVELSFNLDAGQGETIDTAVFRNGTLSLQMNGLSTEQAQKIRITVDGLYYKNDTRPMVLSANATLQLTPDHMFRLGEGNKLTLRFSGEVPVGLAALNGALQISGGDLDYAAGFFGRKVLNDVTADLEVSVDFIDFLTKADYIWFADPAIGLTVRNTYNAPMLIDLKTIRINGTGLSLKPGPGSDRLLIAPRSVSRMTLNNAATTDGRQLSDLLTKDFRTLALEASAILNPTASDVGDPAYVAPEHNAIRASDVLGGRYEIRLPLDAVLDKVAFDQELAVDLTELDKDNIRYEELVLTLSGTNAMPLDFRIMATIPDQSGNPVKLFDEPVSFPAATPNIRPGDPGFRPGTVDGTNLISVKLPQERIYQLLEADNLSLQLQASTAGAAARIPAKIYSPSEINLRLSLGAKADMTLDK